MYESQGWLTLLKNQHRNTITTWSFWQIKVGYDLLNQLRSYMNIMQFHISPRKKMQLKRYLSYQDFIRKFFCEFCIIRSKLQNITSANRGGIADILLLRALLTIHQKSQESIFWQMKTSWFINIYKLGSFKSPFYNN